MSWAIVADSGCDFRSYIPEAPDTAFYVAPLTIQVDDIEYTDDAALDIAQMSAHIARKGSVTSSSCPSAGAWADLFRRADQVIAISISSSLSGSYEAALMARNIVMDEVMRENDGVISGKDIFVLDSKATGAKLELIVRQLDRFLAARDPSFDEAVEFITDLERASTVLFSLSSYDNLVRSGRMPKMAGLIAGRLHVRMLGTATKQGTIRVIGSTRTEKAMTRSVVEHMAKSGFAGGMVYINHVENDASARRVRDAILRTWPAAQIEIVPCGGLNSYYAEASGLIIGYEWLSQIAE